MAIGINNKVKVFTLIIGKEEVCRNTDSEFIANYFKAISDQEDGFLGEVTLRVELEDEDWWEKRMNWKGLVWLLIIGIDVLIILSVINTCCCIFY